MNRPPTPDVQENQEKEPTLQETINIKVLFFFFFFSNNLKILFFYFAV